MAAYVHDYGAGQNGACVSAESNLATLDSIICDLTNRLGNIGSRLADTVNNIYGVRPEANAKDQARLDTAPNPLQSFQFASAQNLLDLAGRQV